MGEIKSVKVDNWGVFFLQKLQNFFNKTDYCDLTLQFRDNSQLKVHRLVLSACTDYFNVLEQTCEVVDDALIMPNELQADVVVPIVNFMYTGTLEFELKMYGKLLRTAKEMNMTVLLKLLEAHRRTMEGVNRAQRPPSPKMIRRRGPMASSAPVAQQPQSPQQPRRILTSANAGPQQQQRRLLQTTKTVTTNAPQQQQFRQQIGSTSLLRTNVNAGATSSSPIKSQYGSTTVYDAEQQFKREPDDYEPTNMQTVKQPGQPPSPFEQLRKGYNNNKRPASASFVSPPTKKPNIEDVKEFAEQQRMRKQIAAEYGDDQEYEGMLDDDIHNDDDDDDAAAAGSSNAAVQASTSRQQQIQQGTATITFKHEQNDKSPTIVVKDSSNSKMNHAKIISEVLRQYPHLVKSNKNIKLKIMPNIGGQTQKIIVKKEQLDNVSTDAAAQPQQVQKSQTLLKRVERPPPQQPPPPAPVQKPAATVIAAATTSTAATATAATSTTGAPQKRRIDSKTMHALIAQGAENTTGPWLCLRCGVNGRPISIPSYRGFRRHLINTHKESIDVALCEHCGWRSSSNRELHYHMQLEHKVKTTLYTFPECLMCTELFLDSNTLNQHMLDKHPDENKQQCIYCNKIFAKELQLYTHMKTYHKKQALDDGIIDYSDEEFMGSHDDEAEVEEKKDTKIKILSDISLPLAASSLIKLEPNSEVVVNSGTLSRNNAEELMDTSEQEAAAAGEPKFVNADGNEMLLTDEQRKEIMSQLNQEHDGSGVVMVLNENTFPANEAAESVAEPDESQDAANTDEPEEEPAAHTEEDEADAATGEVGEDEDDCDDSEIYSEFASKRAVAAAAITAVEQKDDNAEVKENAAASTLLDESKESIDNLEWAENLISAHDLEDDEDGDAKEAEQKAKKDDDISKKLKELTGDWSDDENDDDEPAADFEADTTQDLKDDLESKTYVAKDEQKIENSKDELENKPKETERTEAEIEEKSATVEEMEHDDAEEEQTAVPDVVEKEENDKIEEDDDIDLALKSLHKGDITEGKEEPISEEVAVKLPVEDVDVIKADVAEVEDKVTITKSVSKEDVKPVDEEMDVDEQTEFITIKNESAKKTAGNEEEETESVAKNEEEKTDQDQVTDDASTAVTAEILPDDKENDAKEKENINEATSTEEAENMKTADAVVFEEADTKDKTDELMETDSNITPVAISKDTEIEISSSTTTTATTTATSSKTADKVKSLISEWGDDEDEDEPENDPETSEKVL